MEFANLLVLNKVDLVTPEQADQLEALLHRLNVTAKVLGSQALMMNIMALCTCVCSGKKKGLKGERRNGGVRPCCLCSQIIRAKHGRVAVSEVLDTHSFSLDVAQTAPGWLAEINAFEAELEHPGQAHHHHHHHHHGGGGGEEAERVLSHPLASSSGSRGTAARVTETEKYGISSFVYYARRPFHPARLLEVALSVTWEGVLRTKVCS